MKIRLQTSNCQGGLVELKFQDAPRMTPSMPSALGELGLAHLWVVYPGTESYSLAKNVRVTLLRPSPLRLCPLSAS